MVNAYSNKPSGLVREVGSDKSVSLGTYLSGLKHGLDVLFTSDLVSVRWYDNGQMKSKFSFNKSFKEVRGSSER